MLKFIADTKTPIDTDKYSELDRYLHGELVDVHYPNFEILQWWKENSSKFHVLYLMARDVLAMSVSTVASESTFSTGGRVIDGYRSKLSAKMVEALICTQNQLLASTSTSTSILEYIDDYNDVEEALHGNIII